MNRALCPICRLHPVAINYYRGDRVYYRSACTPCIHQKRKPTPDVAGWIRAGYKPRDRCDRCQFRFRSPEQSTVYYIDGDTNNNNWTNLRTICLNCQFEVVRTRWKPSSIQPDF